MPTKLLSSFLVLVFAVETLYGGGVPSTDIYGKLGPNDKSPEEIKKLLATVEGFRTGFSSVRRSELSNVRARDGDLRLTIDQYMRLHDKRNDRQRVRLTRKADSDLSHRWTDNTMPYTFAPDTFSDEEKSELRKAMDLISNLTCIEFREKRDSDRNWVIFQDNGSGCNSELGMVGIGGQPMNLDDNGCRWHGLYLHELGHALGLIHEHQRPDRDDHLRVIWRRVKPSYIDAFDKYAPDSVNYYDTEYDPSSIMHYEDTAFGERDSDVTIILREEWKRKYLTRVYFKTLSWTDTKILNQMYKCGAQCNVQCPSNAYVDKNCKCITPDDIYNELCFDVIQPKRYCNDRLVNSGCTGDEAATNNFLCRKTCDSCPKYGRDHILKPKYELADDAWANRHFNDSECLYWAEEQYCETFRPSWMKRNCRRACGEWWCKRQGIPMDECETAFAKHFPHGKCRNIYNVFDDQKCDRFAEEGKCHYKINKLECADSCQECGYQEPGDCEDSGSDCDRLARSGACDSAYFPLALRTQTQCRKSCNSCGFNAGQCENTLVSSNPDMECAMAAMEGKCQTNVELYKDKCRKACNSCDYNQTGQCENKPNSRSTCYWLRVLHKCRTDVNIGTAMHFCGMDCNNCEYMKNPVCEDLHPDCPVWDDEECINNAQFMFTNCKKKCGVCDKFAPETCSNYDLDVVCEDRTRRGMCAETSAENMMHREWCPRSCGFCQAPPIDLGECRDLSPENCEYWKGIGSCTDPIHGPKTRLICPVSCDTCDLPPWKK